jgi:small subunit ribosomal protein S9
MTEKKSSFIGATGKRKSSIASVRIYQGGDGECTVNELPIKAYFHGFQTENALAPLALVGMEKSVDLEVRVIGGGKVSQSDAVRHGISRALLLINPELRSELKRVGFLRRDSRIKERKKPGLHRARRAPQFSKR